ncbi:MAG: hypothetical protein Q8K02_07125 [Flavobacterium sp.]|nr:hypothetical protein [Flavobacterium sp.]
MKKIFLATLFLTAFFGLVSCSSDGDSNQNSTTFKVNNVDYTLPTSQGIIYSGMSNGYIIDDTSYEQISIVITGLKDVSEVATLSFDLYKLPGQPIAGDYQASINEEDDVTSNFEQLLSSHQRACFSYTSLMIVSTFSMEEILSGHAPTGTVKIISNGGNSYTIKYNGDFKKSDEDTIVPVEINITGTINLN